MRVWLWALSITLLPTNAPASERLALVVGNSAYQHTSHLPNPVNDAQLLADTLRGIGFTVDLHTDLDRSAMERAVLGFGRRAGGAEVALVFYAGHGIQLDGRNWLLPVDAKLEDDLALQIEAVNLDLLLQAVGAAQTRVVVLDACRNNPFASRMRVSHASRSVGRGLAPVEMVGGGTLIAYSTSPDDIAADGDGRNSPFSAALARYLGEPGLEIRQVFTRVRADVLATTGQRQTPWENSSLLGDVFLAGKTTLQRPVEGIPADVGELRIEVSPATAQLRIDSVLLGSGSRMLREPAGKVVLIRAEADGHEPAEERVRVQGGQVADVRLRLVLRGKPASMPAAMQATSVAPRVVPTMAVQIAVFATSYAAEELVAELRSDGHEAYVEPAPDLGYRVRVGPFARRDDALRAKEALKQTRKLDGLIVSHP